MGFRALQQYSLNETHLTPVCSELPHFGEREFLDRRPHDAVKRCLAKILKSERPSVFYKRKAVRRIL